VFTIPIPVFTMPILAFTFRRSAVHDVPIRAFTMDRNPQFGIDATQLPINIIIAALDPSGQGGRGAYHYGCSATDLYCDLKNVPSLDIDFTRMLLVAELVEVFEAAQNLGFSLGRVCLRHSGEL